MDLQRIIEEYQPTEAAIGLVRRSKIALLVGIAGAGKDSIKKELLKNSDFQDIVSHTTRPPRHNNGVSETDTVDYYFINNDIALSMAKNQEFIETKFVHGTAYGTSLSELEKAYDSDKIAITDIDVQGVDEYKRLSSMVVAIFILPPDYDTWLHRLRSRYSSPEELKKEFPKRRTSAIKELTYALEVPYYHFIINDELERAVQAANEIAHKPDLFHRKDDEARLAARDLLEAIKTYV